MKALPVLAVAAVASALSLPAGAASPPPAKRISQLQRQVDAFQAKVRRLQAENRNLVRSSAFSARRERALLRRVVAEDSCPITRPNGSAPPGSTFGAEFHGNGALWVGVPPSNVVVRDPEPDGSIAEKFGWWREATGRLEIQGRRLDQSAPPLRSGVPDGYGDTGFQSSGLVFPTEGCWEVTGSVGTASLTFVTLVITT